GQMTAFGVPYVGGVTPSGGIPEGLIGFKVYQDSEWIADVAYDNEGTEDWIYHVINPIDPGTYLYDVSAIYDLTSYGFAGEIGESAWEGTDTVHVVWGFPLPFFEGWDQGTFGFNSWMTSGTNWKINSVAGSPAPAAEFTWDPLLENDYSSTLTSNPLDADLMTEGNMFLDFDIKLNDRNSTGLEMLTAEVYNGSTWSTVATFVNDGSFDWTSNHIDISDYAMTNAFRIRFNATGMNSFDVISWFVDNISVYRTCQSVSDLAAREYNLEDVLVTWNAPVAPVVAEWLYYDDATIEYVMGSTADWSIDEAIRFEPAQMVDFAGAAVTKISVFIDSRLIGTGTVSAKIWQGANASNLIYEEDITSQIVIGDDFNEVTLATPVAFDNTVELWIGVNTAGPANTYGVGITTDMGSWNPNADLINDGGGWSHIQDMGISNRAWLLRGFVTTAYQTVQLGSYTDHTTLIGGGQLLATSADVTINTVTTDREISGFKVYRKTDEMGDYTELFTVPAEAGVEAYSFLDETTEIGGSYWYQVTCVWESATDFCESAPGWNVAMTEDFVFVIPVLDVDDEEAGELNLYPNPAKDRVNVTSKVAMKHISVMNYVGQVVYTADVAGENSVELNTSSFEAGVYVVQINTANGLVTKRVVITE
ncbi:MAG: T9SS type A sorting domain-containing protein, partial [Bacteroidales bacterium]|nr:T9SS type A sorting domain-containing protein [Bacteroidales bacterium]